MFYSKVTSENTERDICVSFDFLKKKKSTKIDNLKIALELVILQDCLSLSEGLSSFLKWSVIRFLKKLEDLRFAVFYDMPPPM